jgi:hypothetical protein
MQTRAECHVLTTFAVAAMPMCRATSCSRPINRRKHTGRRISASRINLIRCSSPRRLRVPQLSSPRFPEQPPLVPMCALPMCALGKRLVACDGVFFLPRCCVLAGGGCTGSVFTV